VHVHPLAVAAAQEHAADPVPERPGVDRAARRDPDHGALLVVHGDRLGGGIRGGTGRGVGVHPSIIATAAAEQGGDLPVMWPMRVL